MSEIDPALVRLPFPRYFDSTMIASAASCEKKFWWSFMRNLVPSPPSLHLHAGGAFAAGLCAIRQSYFERSEDEETALSCGLRAAIRAWGRVEAPEDFPKTLFRVCEALTFYVDSYPLASDPIRPLVSGGKATVEFSFALPLDVAHPVTGEPIIYCGRSDMIGLYRDALYICDEKTTTQLGATWSGKWGLRGQFTGYVWAAREFDYNIAGSIIRGVSFLSNSRYGTAEAITFRPEWHVDRWLRNTVANIERLKTAWSRDEWRYSFADACESYGGCEFVRLCESEEPESWIAPYYEKRVWDPLSHTERIPKEFGQQPLLIAEN